MQKSTIESYFSGTTTREEEQELLRYFSSEKVDSELIQYQKYFRGLAKLTSNSHGIIPEEEYENFTSVSKNYAYYLKRLVIPAAAAASVVLFVLFSPIFNKNSSFVVINGKKYTDKKHIELVFNSSLENVKLDAKQIFDDFDVDLLN
ncbi:MAG: hypothetical protein FWC10_09695 [Lentimicrobiaceae bacterium]|nr:hypothetical protein [Lentimicrobiaceae bacterium]